MSLVLLLGIAAGGAAYWAKQRFHAPGPHAEPVTVIIEPGSSATDILTLLAAAGALADPAIDRPLFRYGIRLTGQAGRLKAGEYTIPAHASLAGIANLLVSGKTVIRRLTVPEGLTSAEIIRLIEATDGLSGEIGAVPPEGSLLPETYHFTRGDSRAGMVARLQTAMDTALAELWPTRADDLPLDSPGEAVVLASIIEKETGLAGERRLVASVFVNRLDRGMRLQSDPTVIFGLAPETGDLGRPLTRADLDTETAYNTYLIAGLPPGPICNPGRPALEAALSPEASDYLYFVADGNGGHAFAPTLAEHNKNVRAWRRLRGR
ncbi:endolytic transglycosylase MltG [Roseospirillum parvum]|nr:endolytic transglycosylase MltG [Roseospirillum parvum]